MRSGRAQSRHEHPSRPLRLPRDTGAQRDRARHTTHLSGRRPRSRKRPSATPHEPAGASLSVRTLHTGAQRKTRTAREACLSTAEDMVDAGRERVGRDVTRAVTGGPRKEPGATRAPAGACPAVPAGQASRGAGGVQNAAPPASARLPTIHYHHHHRPFRFRYDYRYACQNRCPLCRPCAPRRCRARRCALLL